MKQSDQKLLEEAVDKDLMEAGYLCPDFKIHQYGMLSGWNDGGRTMTCKNCGKVTVAMAKTL